MPVPKKYEHIDFKPTQGMVDAAKRGLEWRSKAGKGGLTSQEAGKSGIGSGVQRASDIANRENLSPDTVRRMKAFFDRHEKNKSVPEGKQPWEDAGRIAWELWAGDAGRSWANKIVRQMESADKKEQKKKGHYIPDYKFNGSQAAEYGKGFGEFVDRFRAGQTSGIGEISESLRRIKQQQKYNIKANAYAKKHGLSKVADDNFGDAFFDKDFQFSIRELAGDLHAVALKIDDIHDKLLGLEGSAPETLKSSIVGLAERAYNASKSFSSYLLHNEQFAYDEQAEGPGTNGSYGYASDKKAYEAFLNKKLKERGLVSVKDLLKNEPKEKIKEFWEEVDKEYKSKTESDVKDLLPGGKADRKNPEDFDAKQLAKGIKVEMEHTKDPSIAKEIAMDHLMENSKYYDHLQEMESDFHDDHSGDYMARSNMSQIEDQADELEYFLNWAEENGERLEDWFEDKVSSVSDDMEELYNYIKHRKEGSKKKKKNNRKSASGKSGYEPTNKDLWERAKAAAKKKFKVYPSAYANLWASKWYKEKGGKWKKEKKSELDIPLSISADLREWLKEEWVDISRKDKSGKHPPCGRDDSNKGGYPKCRPKSEADKMSTKEKERATNQKRNEPNPKSGKGNKPTRDNHRKRD